MKCNSLAKCKKYLKSEEGKWLLVILAVLFFPIFVLYMLWYFASKFKRN